VAALSDDEPPPGTKTSENTLIQSWRGVNLNSPVYLWGFCSLALTTIILGKALI